MNTLRTNNLPKTLLLACGLLVLSALSSAHAARVDNLYGATVEVPRNSMDAAFDLALSEVLVKVTGQPSAGAAAVRKSLPSGASLVQQYSRLPQNRVSARFNPEAIRKAVDSAGLPFWGDDRPLVAVWLAADAGGGRRLLMPAGDGDTAANPGDALGPLRDAVFDAAERRGLPIVIPLMDAEDRSVVTTADIWGDFRTPVMQASERYGAEAVLIGRARNLNPGDDRVRWSLTMGSDRINWEGAAASGPERAAEYLSQRFATTAQSAGGVRVLVKGVTSLEDYGELLNFLESLSIVEDLSLARANGTDLAFVMVVRGDQQRLKLALQRNQSLQPAAIESHGLQFDRFPDLVYAWKPKSP